MLTITLTEPLDGGAAAAPLSARWVGVRRGQLFAYEGAGGLSAAIASAEGDGDAYWCGVLARVPREVKPIFGRSPEPEWRAGAVFAQRLGGRAFQSVRLRADVPLALMLCTIDHDDENAPRCATVTRSFALTEGEHAMGLREWVDLEGHKRTDPTLDGRTPRDWWPDPLTICEGLTWGELCNSLIVHPAADGAAVVETVERDRQQSEALLRTIARHMPSEEVGL